MPQPKNGVSRPAPNRVGSELGKNIGRRNPSIGAPSWHLKYLEDRERAIAEGEDSFISLEALEDEIGEELRSQG